MTMDAQERIQFAIDTLRACRKSALADGEKYGPEDHLSLMQSGRADAYEFAISLLDPDSQEAKDWEAKIHRTSVFISIGCFRFPVKRERT